MKKKVFVTRRIPEEGLGLLCEKMDVEVNPEDRVLTKNEVIEGLKGKDALLCLLTDKIDAEIMDSNKNLRVIANYAVGYDNIDIKAATERKIPVTNTPGVLTETTADLTWALVLAVSRRIVEGDKFIRAGKYKGWAPMLLLGGDVFGKTLGIIGLGRIGFAVAKRAQGFSMKILYTDVSRAKKEIEEKSCAKFVTLPQLLKESDIVTIHVPLLADTHHLISEKELRMMKKTAYLINAARGPIVDEKALARALREKWIAGAGLDVYEEEPKVFPDLLKQENCVLLPHLGSASFETRGKMARIAAENILAVFEGKTPPNIVNPEVRGK